MPQMSLRGLQYFFAGVTLLRAPLIIAILAFFLLSAPEQTLEIYLTLARDWWRLWHQALLALGSLVALSFFIAFTARELISKAAAIDSSHPLAHAQDGVLRLIPIVIGILPLAGAAFGLYLAMASTVTPDIRQTTETFAALKSQAQITAAIEKIKERDRIAPIGSDIYTSENLRTGVSRLLHPTILDAKRRAEALQLTIHLAIALCMLSGATLTISFAWPRLLRTPSVGMRYNTLYGSALRFSLYIAAVAAVSIFGAQSINVYYQVGYDFTSIARALGTIFIVNLWLTCLVFFCSLLTIAHGRTKIPFLTILVIAAVFFSMWNWNDNHAVRLMHLSKPGPPNEHPTARTAASPPSSEKALPNLHAAFRAWLSARPPHYTKQFEGHAYPIYFVAAQGGGMYAANLSGLFLARLYDRCPAIRHHLFLVSAVSGGSIGSGYFSALLNDTSAPRLEDACNLVVEPSADGKGPLEKRMELLLQEDFLAPIVAALLFPDFLQRFLPASIDALDRARSFEAGLEQAWERTVKSSPTSLRQPFSKHWSPNGVAPMLVLSSTVVETGRQIGFAPVPFASSRVYSGFQSQHWALGMPAHLDVPLSTAMSLSARFPIVMPPGVIRIGGHRYRLADGGYFENSAVEMAAALINDVQSLMKCSGSVCEDESARTKRRLRFDMFILSDDVSVLWDESAPRQGKSQGFAELMSPVRAMLNARIARSELAVNRAWTSFGSHHVALSHSLYRLPLGWQLSRETQIMISAQIGDLSRCHMSKSSDGFPDEPQDPWMIVNAIANVVNGLELLGAEREKRHAKVEDVPLTAQVLHKMATNNCVLEFNVKRDISDRINR